MIIAQVNRIIAKLNLKLVQIRQKNIICNPFNTAFRRNALISYLPEAFINSSRLSHTNFKECYYICQLFKELEYNIDIISFAEDGNDIDYCKYDIIFGFGEPFNNCFYHELKDNRIAIYYGTGCHVNFQNIETAKRVDALRQRKHHLIPESGRFVEKVWTCQTSFIDYMILLGNVFVKRTFEPYFPENKIYTIPASFHKAVQLDVLEKDFKLAGKNFLWFGSAGLVHKGLDLVLEAFKDMPDLHLHVCGPMDSETRFINVYQEYLYNTPNVHSYGFIDLKSVIFADLMKKCGFVIFPSASEGGAPSVVTPMGNGGLVPICTKSCGLDIDDVGFVIENVSIDGIKKIVRKASDLDQDELKHLTIKSYKYAEERHSFAVFSEKLKDILKDLIR